MSKEHKRKIGLSNSKVMREKWADKEYRKKQTEAQKGHFISDEFREKCSKRMIGKKYAVGHTPWNRGIPMTNEIKEILGIKAKLRIGAKSPNWKGGINPDHQRQARHLSAGGKYTNVQWETLKKKYNFMCLCCKQQEPFIKLTVDHIIPFSVWTEWAKENNPDFGGNDIENIQPLCLACNKSKFTKIIDYRELTTGTKDD